MKSRFNKVVENVFESAENIFIPADDDEIRYRRSNCPGYVHISIDVGNFFRKWGDEYFGIQVNSEEECSLCVSREDVGWLKPDEMTYPEFEEMLFGGYMENGWMVDGDELKQYAKQM